MTYIRTQFRGLVRTVEPTGLPVSLVDIKAMVGIADDDTTFDDMLDALVRVATDYVEEQTGAALLTQTWRLSLDNLPSNRNEWWDGTRELPVTYLDGIGRFIELPRWPVQSVTSVTLYDDEDDATVVDSAIYYVDTDRRPGRIALRRDEIWPTVVLRAANGVQVVFVAGYGSDPCDVPGPLVQAIKMMAAFLFEHRGECDVGDAATRSGAALMLGQYKVRRL